MVLTDGHEFRKDLKYFTTGISLVIHAQCAESNQILCCNVTSPWYSLKGMSTLKPSKHVKFGLSICSCGDGVMPARTNK